MRITLHVDNINKEMMHDKGTLLRRKESCPQIYMLRVLHTIVAYSNNIGAKLDTCQTDVENTSVQYGTTMRNAPK